MKHVTTAYWCTWGANQTASGVQSKEIRLKDIPDGFSRISVAFISSKEDGIIPQLEPATWWYSDQQMIDEIQSLRDRDIEVVASLSGNFSWQKDEDSNTYVETVVEILKQFGFTGVDVDFEGEMARNNMPKIIENVKRIMDIMLEADPKFTLTFAPEHCYLDSNYKFPIYKQFYEALEEYVTMVYPQCYTNTFYPVIDPTTEASTTVEDLSTFIPALVQCMLKGENGYIKVPAEKLAMGVFGANDGDTCVNYEKRDLQVAWETIQNLGLDFAGYMLWSIDWDMSLNWPFLTAVQECYGEVSDECPIPEFVLDHGINNEGEKNFYAQNSLVYDPEDQKHYKALWDLFEGCGENNDYVIVYPHTEPWNWEEFKYTQCTGTHRKWTPGDFVYPTDIDPEPTPPDDECPIPEFVLDHGINNEGEKNFYAQSSLVYDPEDQKHYKALWDLWEGCGENNDYVLVYPHEDLGDWEEFQYDECTGKHRKWTPGDFVYPSDVDPDPNGDVPVLPEDVESPEDQSWYEEKNSPFKVFNYMNVWAVKGILENDSAFLKNITHTLVIGDAYLKADGSLLINNHQQMIDNVAAIKAADIENKELTRILITFIDYSGAYGVENFRIASSTEEGRKAFAQKCLQLCQSLKVHGVDIDWEEYWGAIGTDPEIGPWPEEQKKNYNLLIEELANTLHPEGYLVTTAAGCTEHDRLVEAMDHLDYCTVMCYDIYGDGEYINDKGVKEPYREHIPVTLFNEINENWIKAHGDNMERIFLGIPTYSHDAGYDEEKGLYTLELWSGPTRLYKDLVEDFEKDLDPTKGYLSHSKVIKHLGEQDVNFMITFDGQDKVLDKTGIILGSKGKGVMLFCKEYDLSNNRSQEILTPLWNRVESKIEK